MNQIALFILSLAFLNDDFKGLNNLFFGIYVSSNAMSTQFIDPKIPMNIQNTTQQETEPVFLRNETMQRQPAIVIQMHEKSLEAEISPQSQQPYSDNGLLLKLIWEYDFEIDSLH